MDTPTPHFLPPFVAEFLSFYAFSGSYYSPGELLETYLFFPKSSATAQVCDFFLAHRLRSDFLSTLHLSHLGAHTRSQQKSGARCEFTNWGIKDACSSDGGAFSQVGFLWSPESSQQDSLMPFDILICLSPHLLSSSSHGCPRLNTVGIAGEKWVSPVASHTAGVAWHSFTTHLFSPKKVCHQLVQPCAVSPWGRDRAGWFLSPSPKHPNLVLFFVFAPMECWNSPSGRLDLYKVSLILDGCPSQHSPGFPQLPPRGVGAGSPAPAGSQTVQRSVFLLPDAQLGDSFQVPWHMVLDPTTL